MSSLALLHATFSPSPAYSFDLKNFCRPMTPACHQLMGDMNRMEERSYQQKQRDEERRYQEYQRQRDRIMDMGRSTNCTTSYFGGTAHTSCSRW